MKFHPAADLFPLMEGMQFEAFAEDIRANGLREPIKTLDGQILDGRNRFRACEKTGKNPRFEALPDDTNPIRYVLSLNWHRRHLSESQRAMIAAEAANMEREDTLKQNRSVPVPNGNPPVTQAEAAKQMEIGLRTVGLAKQVMRKAVPEVVDMVKKGRLKVKKAAKISTLPKEEQIAAAAKEFARKKKSPVKPMVADEEAGANGEIKVQGVGVIRAHEAINCLSRIPKNDALRKRGFQIVKDWIRHNP